MSRNVRYALIILVLILLWILSGFIFSSDKAELSDDTQNTKALTKVVVTPSGAQVFQPMLSFNARTEAFREGTIRAQTSGPVLSIEQDEGAIVEEDDLLISLDQENRVLRVREAEALLTQTKLEYQAGLSLQKKALLSEADVARNLAAMDSAQAAVDSAKLELERVRIKSPFSGYINERFVELGDFVQIGQEVVEILQLHPIKAVFQVAESEMLQLNDGAAIELVLSDGRELTGSLLFRSAKADETNRTFRVEAVFDNEDRAVLADLTGKVSVQRGELFAHSLPASLLSLNTEGVLIVKTLGSDNIVESVPVNILSDQADKVWVTGLPEQADVITRGYEYVGVGEEVAPSYSDVSAE